MAGLQLTPGQSTFVQQLSKQTGLNPALVSGWVYNEQNGPAAQNYQQRGYNNWLNIGNTDQLVGSGGSNQQSAWSNPVTAANMTAAWLTGKSNAGGYGYAAPGIQSFAKGAMSGNQPLAQQVAALQNSGWASGGYPNLPSLVSQFSGQPLPTTPDASRALASAGPPGQPAVPNVGPRLQPVNMPPAPSLPQQGGLPSNSAIPLSANSASGILPAPGSLSSSDILGSAANALGGMTPMAPPAPHPLSTPAQQVQQPVVKATTPTGVNVEVAGKPDVRDVRAIQLAEHFLGTPYSYGGGGPSGPSYGIKQGANIKGFDCSSLIQYVWAKQGIDIGRTTYDQYQEGKAVARDDLKPGDAVYFTGSDPRGNLPGHVGMYIGNGKFVEAPYTGADIRISNLADRSDYVGARTFV